MPSHIFIYTDRMISKLLISTLLSVASLAIYLHFPVARGSISEENEAISMLQMMESDTLAVCDKVSKLTEGDSKHYRLTLAIQLCLEKGEPNGRYYLACYCIYARNGSQMNMLTSFPCV